MKTEITAFVYDKEHAFRSVTGSCFVEIPQISRMSDFKIPLSEEMFRKISESQSDLKSKKLKITVEFMN